MTPSNFVSNERTDAQYLMGEAYKRYHKKCVEAKQEYEQELRAIKQNKEENKK